MQTRVDRERGALAPQRDSAGGKINCLLNNYAELYEDWVDETGVKIVAVSIDDQRSMNRVAPYVNSVGWEYDILLDPNRDFARADVESQTLENIGATNRGFEIFDL